MESAKNPQFHKCCNHLEPNRCGVKVGNRFTPPVSAEAGGSSRSYTSLASCLRPKLYETRKRAFASIKDNPDRHAANVLPGCEEVRRTRAA